VCADHLHSILETLRGQSVVEKTKWNHAVLFPARFTTLWRSEIHIDLKIDADVLYRRRRRFVSGIQCIISTKGYGGHILDTANACKNHKK